MWFNTMKANITKPLAAIKMVFELNHWKRCVNIVRLLSSLSGQLVVVVALLFYVHGKHLRSCRDGQLT